MSEEVSSDMSSSSSSMILSIGGARIENCLRRVEAEEGEEGEDRVESDS